MKEYRKIYTTRLKFYILIDIVVKLWPEWPQPYHLINTCIYLYLSFLVQRFIIEYSLSFLDTLSTASYSCIEISHYQNLGAHFFLLIILSYHVPRDKIPKILLSLIKKAFSFFSIFTFFKISKNGRVVFFFYGFARRSS